MCGAVGLGRLVAEGEADSSRAPARAGLRLALAGARGGGVGRAGESEESSPGAAPLTQTPKLRGPALWRLALSRPTPERKRTSRSFPTSVVGHYFDVVNDAAH